MTPSPPRRTALLQLAVDVLSTEEALELARAVYPHFDILEVGTPLILEQGLSALEALREACPGKRYLADLKVMDAGRLEASSGFRRGADIVTVLGAADDRTIRGALDAAGEYGGEVMAALINVADPAVRARRLEEMGVHLLCVHTAHDVTESGGSPLRELVEVRSVTRCPLAVAGGLDLRSVGLAVRAGADILVVGSAITRDRDSAGAARAFQRQMEAVS